jgi:hypothetical protein
MQSEVPQFSGKGPTFVVKNTFIDEAPMPPSLERSQSAPAYLMDSVFDVDLATNALDSQPMLDGFREQSDSNCDDVGDFPDSHSSTDGSECLQQKTSANSFSPVESFPLPAVTQQPSVMLNHNFWPGSYFHSSILAYTPNPFFSQEGALSQISLGQESSQVRPMQTTSIVAPSLSQKSQMHLDSLDELVDTSDVSSGILQGQVWRLAKDPRGCRKIQQILENAESNSERALISCELRTHVWEAIWSPHANYVIQKCISTMRPCDSQFIIDEILQQGPGAVVAVAAHQYGCRILQRFLEHFPSDRLQVLIEDVLSAVRYLSMNEYGSFFIQHLLEYGDASYVGELLQSLTLHASSLASDPYGVTVLGKALTHARKDAQESLANALASQPRWLVSMSSWRHGYLTAKLTIQAAAPYQRNVALEEVQRCGHKLKNSRYGRKLLTFAEAIRLQGNP